MDLTILGSSYKWNQTVIVHTYCTLEDIFTVNLYVRETDCTSRPPVILNSYLFYTQ